MVKKSLPHFYWTKKKADASEKILSNTSLPEGIILDPFMGSGQSILGINLDKYKYIGIELNEMPIKMLKQYLSQLTEDNLNSATLLIDELKKKYDYVYELKCPSCNNKIYYEKVIFDNIDGDIEVKEIKVFCESCSYKYDNVLYNEDLNLQYKAKIKLYARKKNEDLKLIKNSRIAIKENMYLSNLFSPMNFYILQEMRIKNEMYGLVEYVIASVLHLIRYTDLKSQSQFPFWIPKTNIVDRNILNQFQKKSKELKKFTHKKKYKLALDFNDLKNNQLLLLHGPAQRELKKIQENSIDILFTDPPYYDQVAYSEYLTIWSFFFKYKVNYDDEIVVSNREYMSANRETYLNLINSVFSECYLKLKDGADIYIYFKDSKQKNYIDFITLLTDIGYIYEKQFHLNKSRITYKQNTTSKTTSRGDCIIYFKKNLNYIHVEKLLFNKVDFFKYLNKLIMEYLRVNINASTGELLDNIIYKEMVFNDISEEVNEKNIFDFLEDNFRFLKGKWEISK